MPLHFQKMISKKSYEHVVEEIEEAIIKGELCEGDKLPSELKLKTMFETSRGTVREALRVLEQKGLVSIKTGVKGGATILKPGTRPIEEGIGLLIRQKSVSLEELAQFRILLEGFASYCAAAKADQNDIEALAAILEQADGLVRTEPDEWDGFHKLDALFHQTLAQIAGNCLIQANLKTVHENIHTYFQQYLPFSQKLLEEDLNDLQRIFKAVESHDPEQAKSLAQSHVQRFSHMMEQGMEQRKPTDH